MNKITSFVINTRVGQETLNVTGGYKTPDGISFICAVKEDEEFEYCYLIEGNIAYWSGGLSKTAQKRYNEVAEGHFFVYKKRFYQRLTSYEILSIVNSNEYQYDIYL